jgi:hypothetical protein
MWEMCGMDEIIYMWKEVYAGEFSVGELYCGSCWLELWFIAQMSPMNDKRYVYYKLLSMMILYDSLQ